MHGMRRLIVGGLAAAVLVLPGTALAQESPASDSASCLGRVVSFEATEFFAPGELGHEVAEGAKAKLVRVVAVALATTRAGSLEECLAPFNE